MKQSQALLFLLLSSLTHLDAGLNNTTWWSHGVGHLLISLFDYEWAYKRRDIESMSLLDTMLLTFYRVEISFVL